jgi:hypothetical protein
LNRYDPTKFGAIVSDNGSNVRKAREIIEKKYPKIKNIRCISHCVNLISCDVVQHTFADKLLRRVNILATFFRNNAMGGMNEFSILGYYVILNLIQIN